MASDYLLEIDGIKGESQDEHHPGSIEVSSFAWGHSNAGSFASGTGGGTGKVSFQDIHFTAPVNKASPLIAQACAKGTHIKTADLWVRKAGGEALDFYSIHFESVLISSYQSGGHEGSSSVPTDQFAFNFAKIEYNYKPQTEQGASMGQVSMKHDLKTNKSG